MIAAEVIVGDLPLPASREARPGEVGASVLLPGGLADTCRCVWGIEEGKFEFGEVRKEPRTARKVDVVTPGRMFCVEVTAYYNVVLGIKTREVFDESDNLKDLNFGRSWLSDRSIP